MKIIKVNELEITPTLDDVEINITADKSTADSVNLSYVDNASKVIQKWFKNK